MHPVIVRCLLCGHSIEVALAIGQMLKCPACGTTFMAPDEAEHHAANSEAETETEKTPPEAEAVVLGTPSSSSVTQSAPALETPILPVNSKGTATLDNPDHETEAAEDTEEAYRHRNWIWAAIALPCVAGVIGVALWNRFTSPPSEKSNSTHGVSQGKAGGSPGADTDQEFSATVYEGEPPFPVRWSPAASRAQRIGRIRVRVVEVVHEPIVAKTKKHKVIFTEGQPFLQIRLQIENLSTQTRSYQSWYGHTFRWRKHLLAATLTDDEGHVWPMVVFDDASAVRGHVAEAELEPSVEVEDLLVFEPPENVKLDNVKSWRLFLPAQAVGFDGGFGFIIDAATVGGPMPHQSGTGQ